MYKNLTVLSTEEATKKLIDILEDNTNVLFLEFKDSDGEKEKCILDDGARILLKAYYKNKL